jgi:hypothetical protein
VKRSPLQRRNQMRRQAWKSQRVTQVDRDREWQQARTWVIDGRADGRCEARATPDCTGRAEHAHHVKLRSRGGSNDPANLLAVCEPCHSWIHGHPDEATEQGLMRPSWHEEQQP